MGKKWRTNKNSNRKHKRSKTKRMRGGLGINPFARKKVTKADIVRYLIKTKNPVNVQFIVPSKSRLPSMLSSNKFNPIDKTVIFDDLEDIKGKLDIKGKFHYEGDSSEEKIKFIIENDTLRVNKEDTNLAKFRELVNRTIIFVSDITKDVEKDMDNTEKERQAKKEQDDKEQQENNRILEEKKANTPKILKVNLLDTRIPKKGIIKNTKIDWDAIYDKYNKSTYDDDNFTKIPPLKKEEDNNNWNFDFFLRCIALNHDIDSLDVKQKPILEQIIQSDDLKRPPLISDESTEVTNPGLIYIAIPGKPETYRGCIIYDIDGKTSSHVQIHTPLEETEVIEYYDDNISDFKKAHPSVIMEEYLQGLFPQFKPPTPDAAATTVEAEVVADQVEADAPEGNAVVADADTANAPEADTPEADAPEADTPEADAPEAEQEENAVVAEPEVEAHAPDVPEAEPEVVTTVEEQGATEEVLSQDNKIKQSSTKVIPTTTKVIPSTSKKNISVSNKEPVKVEEINLEMEEETNENVKPKEQPKKQLDTKINDDLNKLILELLINTNV
jgi:hypothetical protein